MDEQLNLFPIEFPALGHEDLYIVAHKCRNTRTIEIAMRWDFGTYSDPAPWWLIQTTGNRIYPYWIGPKVEESIAPLPLAHVRDFYQAHIYKEPPKQLTIDDLL